LWRCFFVIGGCILPGDGDLPYICDISINGMKLLWKYLISS
jgi:hypothetical protein